MTAYVADTHALFWYLMGSPKLSAAAQAAFDAGDRGEAIIYVPAIVLTELYWFNRKHEASLDFFAAVEELQRSMQFKLLPDTPEETLDLAKNEAVPEMHDRMIVGHCLRRGLPLITRDAEIIASGLVTVVW